MKPLCVQMAALSVNTCETPIRAILEQLIEYCYCGERGTKRCMFAAIPFFCCCFIWCFSFRVLISMRLSTQGSLCHYTPHYPLKWHSLFESKWGPTLTTSRGLTAETKRTLNWMKCQQICLLSWVMDLALTLFQQYSVFKQCCSSAVFNLMKLIFCILLSTHITEINTNANM